MIAPDKTRLIGRLLSSIYLLFATFRRLWRRTSANFGDLAPVHIVSINCRMRVADVAAAGAIPVDIRLGHIGNPARIFLDPLGRAGFDRLAD